MEELNTPKKEFQRGFFWGIIVMLAVVAVILLFQNGKLRFQEGNAQQTVANNTTQKKLQVLAEIIDSLYYEEVDKEQIAEGLYNGLLDSLNDPYSQYYNEEDFNTLMDSTSGSYYGIGVVLTQDPETMEVTILHVYEGSPAREAGIKAGDIIISVDGIEIGTEELSEMVKHIKGEEGSRVSVVVKREGETESLEFSVERRQVEVPTVEYQMLNGQVGLLQISEFSDKTAGQFQTAVKNLSEQGMTSLIIDLRDNPGGVLDAVNEVLDQILPEGIIVYTEDKNNKRTEYTSSGDTYMELPLAVLVNENSASASEIFAGAIQDYEYGTLIGTTTFGKGIVQQIIPLSDGSAAKITMARYFTPKGNYIHGVGIKPDIELEYEYLDSQEKEYNPMYDNQVLKALEILGSR